MCRFDCPVRVATASHSRRRPLVGESTPPAAACSIMETRWPVPGDGYSSTGRLPTAATVAPSSQSLPACDSLRRPFAKPPVPTRVPACADAARLERHRRPGEVGLPPSPLAATATSPAVQMQHWNATTFQATRHYTFPSLPIQICKLLFPIYLQRKVARFYQLRLALMYGFCNLKL